MTPTRRTMVASSDGLELVRFLLARVSEDEDELRRLQRDHTRGKAPDNLGGVRAIARQRAECEVRRSVIGQAQHLLVLRDLPAELEVREAALAVLKALAQPHSEHRGYRPEWSLHRASPSARTRLRPRAHSDDDVA